MKVDRKPHILKRCKTGGYPRNMIFFDTESKPIRGGDGRVYHEPYLYVGYWYYIQSGNRKNIEQWFWTTNHNEFWDWVLSKVSNNERLYLFAHNPSYDLITSRAFPILKEKGYHITHFHNEGHTFILRFILRFRSEKKTLVVLNVGNFFPGTVESMGKSFGLEKLELDYENPNLDDAIEYCKKDVEIIATAMLSWFKFCQDNDLGAFGLTAPKQAFNAFRRRFMKHDIYIHADEKAIALERASYYGGRTEAFYIGPIKEEKAYALDVASMYPAMMHAHLFPTKLIAYRENLSPEGLRQVMENYLVCAKVKVKIDIPCIPCKTKDRLFFPVGTFITTLVTPELELVYKYGEVKEVYAVSIYESAPLFTDFVDFFYTERMKAKERGDKVTDSLMKLIMNALSGKFGQKSGKWEIVDYTDREDVGNERVFNMETGKWEHYKYFNNVVLMRVEEKEAHDSFPAIVGHITGYARVRLFEYITQAGFDNVYYTDTDSLFVNEEGLRRLEPFIAGKKLGLLEFEGELHDLVIYGLKDYAHRGGEKHKGIPKNAERLSENRWKVTLWPKLSTMIREDSLDRYFNIETEKELKRRYMKGWVLNTGRVVPFEVTVIGNENYIVDWEKTSYAKQGLSLKNPEQVEWVRKEFKGCVIW